MNSIHEHISDPFSLSRFFLASSSFLFPLSLSNPKLSISLSLILVSPSPPFLNASSTAFLHLTLKHEKTLLLFSQAGNFMQTTIKRLSTTHKRKDEKEREQEQEKKIRTHVFSPQVDGKRADIALMKSTRRDGGGAATQQHLLAILHLPSMQIGSTFVVQVPVSNVLRRPHMLLTHAFSSATSQFGPSPELSVSVSLFSVSLFQLRLKCRCLAGSRPRANIPLPRNGNHSLACWPYGCGWRFENV